MDNNDIKVHHKTDLKTFFSRVPKGPILCNFTNRNESLDFIPESSDEIIMPSTSKQDVVKKSCRKQNLNESEFSIETASNPNKPDIQKSLLIEKKTKTKPKIKLSRKRNKAKQDDSDITLKPKLASRNKVAHKSSEKKKILKWLHDTQNEFEIFSDSAQYENLQQINSSENQLAIDIKEDEVLGDIDKEISSGRNDTPDFSKELNTENYNSKAKNAFLDQLENEMLKKSSYMKKESTIQKSLNRSENNKKNKPKSSCKNIKKIKTTKVEEEVPKKLDIQLLSIHKSNENDVQTENTNDSLMNIDRTVIFGKTEEEYLSRTIPKMIEPNVVETTCLEIMNEKDIYQKDSEANQDNDSDIYVYQTQPLSKETVDPRTDRKSVVLRLTQKLETILQQLLKEGIQMNELFYLYPSFEGIFKIFHKLNDNKAYQSHESRNHRKFSDKQNQTDLLSLNGFTITPTVAYNSLIHEDVATQTTDFCLDYPQFSLEKVLRNSTPAASSSQIMDMDTLRNVESGKNPKSKKPSQSNLELHQQSSMSKSQFEIANIQMKSSSLNEFEFEKQISVNASVNKGHNDILVDNIFEQCNTQHNVSYNHPTMRKTSNRTQMNSNHSSSRLKNYSDKSRSNSRVGIDISQGSGIMRSVPQLRVSRRLIFENTMKERTEVEQKLKRERTMDSTSDSDEKRPYKVKFSKSLHDKSQCSRYSDVEMKEINQEHSGVEKRSVSPANSEKFNTKTHQSDEDTKADALMKYFDELIEKANQEILEEDLLSKQKELELSQILSENDKHNTHHEILNHSVTERQVKTQQDIESIGTQDLKYYDKLIEKDTRQIEIENDNQHKEKLIRDNYKESPIASKHNNCLEEEENVETKRKLIKTQDLLDDCNILIANTTMEIRRNEMSSSHKENNTQSQNDDEICCQNMYQLDNVLEKGSRREVLSRDEFSKSFGSCKENLTKQTSSIENKTTKSNDLFYTARRNNSQEERKIRRKKKNAPRADGDNSVADVVDTSPKSLSFLERLSCSQNVKRDSKMSLQIEEDIKNTPAIMNIIPPPGFDDEILIEEKVNPNTQSSEGGSESGIPNSISPQKFKVPSKRKRLVAAKVKTVKFAVPQELTTHCREESKNLNEKKKVRQSIFSPLTIEPKTSASVLTSTLKQKSILSYAKPKLSQQASTSTSQKPKPCIAFTRLNNAETSCVHSLCNRNLVTRQDQFGPDVTHMIVSVDKHNNVKYHTIKFISAIAAGIWVVNIKWVQECLSQNCIVDEEPFEVFDITGIPSPSISRLTRVVNPLLKGFKFYVPRSFAQASAEDVKNIILSLQGVVVSSIEELVDRGDYTCIIISELVDSKDYDQYEDWLSVYKILTVDINWLSLSVSRYNIHSLRPYLLCSDDSIYELGYPSDLVVDVAPCLTQNDEPFF
ncbi:uncharacterized protein LOC123312254 isoform X2 [Coccinella septempunctata]|uniref:uncharacterized protein LOC123312254 isoform X2 n=1 Tax=Coccinella septempunctata TaxID=41139 RepID=UPI001D090514|nr:uncharacterized protein LOC123312254 isoform X2 [Coccinella septempunctata]